MDWLQVLVIVFGNVAWVLPLWLWQRSESRADSRKHDDDLKAYIMKHAEDNRELRRDLIEVQRKGTEQLNSAILAIKDEMRDFHGRLCAIEERRKG